MKQKQQSRFIPILLGLCAVLTSMMLLVGGCATQTQEEAPSEPTPSEPEAPAEEEEETEAEIEVEEVEVEKEDTDSEVEKTEEAMMGMLADGAHVEEVTYTSPGGQDTFEITVETESDVVTAVSLEVVEAHEVSTKYIGGVNDALPDLVVGKKIGEIELPAQISGSSLTTAAVQKHLDSLAN